MGVLYEHWRPDLNECFYVGVSWAKEDRRPYNMDGRNYRHIEVQEELAKKGLSPEVRLVECAHLSKDELGEFEVLQIAYWKDLIGKRLTNIGRGGAGIDIDWDDELRERASKAKRDFINSPEGELWLKENKRRQEDFRDSPEGRAWSDKQRENKLTFFSTPEGDSWKKNHGDWWDAFLSSEEGKNYGDEQSKRLLDFYSTPEGEKWKDAQSKRRQKLLNSPEGEKWCQQQSDDKKEFYSTPDGAECIKKISSKVSNLWKTPEYRNKMLLVGWWRSNVYTRFYWGA